LPSSLATKMISGLKVTGEKTFRVDRLTAS